MTIVFLIWSIFKTVVSLTLLLLGADLGNSAFDGGTPFDGIGATVCFVGAIYLFMSVVMA